MFRNRSLRAALLIFAPAAAIAAPEAHAQTATNLVCSGCVGKNDLGNKGVSTKKVKDGAIRARNLHKSAKPAGVGFVTSTDPIALTGNHTTMLSIDVAAPGPGFFVTTADFTVDFPAGGAFFGCDILTGVAQGLNDLYGQGTNIIVPASLTRTIPVDAGGDVTINLMCTEGAGDVEIDNVNLTALFVPAAY